MEKEIKDLANTYRPQFFSDFNSENIVTNGTVRVLQNVIKDNRHDEMPAILLSGSSGCGKSTLALLYAKATLCLNRLPGEYEPCGHCEVCTGLDSSNIYHHTITNPTESREPIRNLIERAEQYPLKISDRKDQVRQFIIIDEIQLASPELLAMLLHPLEHSPSTTTWILVTMDLDKLQAKDEVAKEAIESRTAHLPLGRLSEEAVAKTLRKQYPDLDYEAASILGKLSGGNMRQAWSALSVLKLRYNDITEITADAIWETKLGSANAYSRERMWRALAEGNGAKIKELFNVWLSSNSDTKMLAKALQDDIIASLNKPNEKAQLLLSALGKWFVSSHPFSLLSVFLSYLGTDIVTSTEEVKAQTLRELKPKREFKSDLFLNKIPDHLKSRASTIKIQSAQTSIPKLFFCQTAEEAEAIYS